MSKRKIFLRFFDTYSQKTLKIVENTRLHSSVYKDIQGMDLAITW
jgi:hypothetical protein